jgi:DNA-binding IclR family transcriptional regulator
VGAQDFLDHGLGYLLAGLGEAVIPARDQAEGAVEVGDAAAGQGRAEGDSLRPGDRQRRGGPEPAGQAPAAQVLHRPDAGGLGPRAAVRHLRPGLDDHAADAVPGELGRGGEAGRAAARDHHGDVRATRPRRRGHAVHGEPPGAGSAWVVSLDGTMEADGMGDSTAGRGRRPAQGEPVLDRAFRILTAFEPGRRSLSLAVLSRRAGLPKPTALRLARKLAELGALERAGNGDYVVGLRLLEIASLAPRGHGLRAAALPYLEDLHHATGQHVLLAVRDGHEAVLIERLSARDAGQVMYRVGGRMPLHSTGVGLVLLAHAPAMVQDEVLGGDLARPPEQGRLAAGGLRALLAAVRRDGVAVVSRPAPESVTSVAALVRDARGAPVAALSVVAPSQRVDAAALRPAVVAVARAVSRAVAAGGAGAGG